MKTVAAKLLLLLGILGCASVIEAAPAACTSLTAWRQLFPLHSAPGRSGHAMAYDSARGLTILFGGIDTNGVILNDTWQFDVHGWKKLTPAHAPSPRYRHTLSYDASTGTIVLFGGRDANVSLGDTWEWNGTDWIAINTSTAPPARFWHGMAFDSARNVHVLFGGVSSQEYGDTWEYSANFQSWSLRSTSGPPARLGIQLAFDAAHNQTVLFGGYTGVGTTLQAHYLSDTWVWNGVSATWSLRLPTTVPQGRTLYSLAFDPNRSVVMMQNGEEAVDATHTGTVMESWEWDGNNWSMHYFFCCPRREGAMVYDLANARMIQYGGDGAYPDFTWSLEPVWLSSGSAGVDPSSSIRGVYHTVRAAVVGVPQCTFINIRDADYNETGSGSSPLAITKPCQLDAYHTIGDPLTVRIH